MTIRSLRKETKEVLNELLLDDADVLTDILLSHHLGVERGELLAKLDEAAPTGLNHKLVEDINALSTGMPIQYILGSCWFYGIEIKVGKGVFIPRSDTELLVKASLGVLKDGDSFVEFCAGSGCVSRAIAENMPSVRGAALELSRAALPYTEHNLKDNHNIKVKRLDVLDTDDYDALVLEWGDRFDVLVCNPPYIPTADIPNLSPQVQFEPETALDGGENGLKYYRYIIANADRILKDEHTILFEVGIGQAQLVASMLELMGYAVAIFKDYGGIDRVVMGKKY
ncbi:MAG: peptide chain release factor N(5)-glutamine methyltransferase [Clostridia bacterium]|nr:peptide chain release factor N(5)-glutamine methyltransferase [Clostridia bacterium]